MNWIKIWDALDNGREMKTETDETKTKKKLSSFIQPQVIPNCSHFLFLLNTKEHILKNSENPSVLVPIDFFWSFGP